MANKNPKKAKKQQVKEQGPQEGEAPKAPSRIRVTLRKATVMVASFSSAYKKLASEQFAEKKVSRQGSIFVAGEEVTPGKPCELALTNEVRALIKGRVLQVIRSSIYGQPKKK